MPEPKKKKIRWSAAWAEARDLIWARRWRLALGLALVVVNTSAGLVLPWSTKLFLDNVTQAEDGCAFLFLPADALTAPAPMLR